MSTRVQKKCDVCGMRSFEPNADFVDTLHSAPFASNPKEKGEDPVIDIRLADGSHRHFYIKDVCLECSEHIYDAIKSVLEFRRKTDSVTLLRGVPQHCDRIFYDDVGPREAEEEEEW